MAFESLSDKLASVFKKLRGKGKLPWIGSYSPRVPSPKLEDGIMPILPVIMLASSERISPNMFSVTITSNWDGSFTICMDALSTYI